MTPVIFALAFTLHGCFLQKKIAEDMQAHSVLVDSILSDFEAAKIAVELPDVLDRVAGECRATAGDTAAINTLLASFALADIQGAKEIDTGRQIIRIRAKEQDGRTVIDLEAVAKPSEAVAKPSGTSQAASIRKPAKFAPQSNETKTPLQILLLIIAALGAAAKALETWINK